MRSLLCFLFAASVAGVLLFTANIAAPTAFRSTFPLFAKHWLGNWDTAFRGVKDVR